MTRDLLDELTYAETSLGNIREELDDLSEMACGIDLDPTQTLMGALHAAIELGRSLDRVRHHVRNMPDDGSMQAEEVQP
jgi:hypothetical protein